MRTSNFEPLTDPFAGPRQGRDDAQMLRQADTVNPAAGSTLTPAVIASLIVGSILTAANQGMALLDGQFDAAPILINFLTPFCVSAATAYLAQGKSRKNQTALQESWREKYDNQAASLTAELESERQARRNLESAIAAQASAATPAERDDSADLIAQQAWNTLTEKIKAAHSSVRVVQGNAKDVNETSRERVQFIDRLIMASESSADRVSTVHEDLRRSAERMEQTLREVEILSGTVTEGADGLVASREALEQMMRSVAAFSDQFGRISSLSETVADISRQTGLLSINASVEAARAGEQGRGFAVVATEVRDLSGRSSEEVAHINAQVRELTEGLNAMIEMSGSVETSVGRSIEASQKAIDHISQTSESIGNVARNAKDQGAVIEQEIARMGDLLNDIKAIRGNTAAAITGSQENINLTKSILDQLDSASNLIATNQTSSM